MALIQCVLWFQERFLTSMRSPLQLCGCFLCVAVLVFCFVSFCFPFHQGDLYPRKHSLNCPVDRLIVEDTTFIDGQAWPQV